MKTNTILESNAALYSIQPCLMDLVEGPKTEILYANEYSGIEPVQMSNDLAQIFNSDFGSVGPNLLVQLKKKVSGIPGGPWYIDSRDGCIYIHNKNFNDTPTYTYSYQANAGELLEATFKTNYVKKKTSGGIMSGVDRSKNTNSEIVFSNLAMDVLNDDKNWTRARQVHHEREIEARKEDEASGENYQRSLYNQNYVSVDEAARIYTTNGGGDKGQAAVNSKVNEARVNAYLAAMTVPELQKEGRAILEQTAINRGVTINDIGNELKEAMEKGELESYLKVMFGNSQHTFNAQDPYHPKGGYPNTFRVVTIDLFSNEYMGTSDLRVWKHSPAAVMISDPPDTEYEINPITGRKQKKTKYDAIGRPIVDRGGNLRLPPSKDNNYQVHSAASIGGERVDQLMTSLKNNHQLNVNGQYKILEEHPLTYTTNDDGHVVYSKMLTLMVESQTNDFVGPTWKILLNLYTRQLGEGKTARDVEAHVHNLLHRNDEVLEKLVTCQLTCIGNPFLKSSQIINLSNLGPTWSGKWYIKTCKHIISSSGYMCQLSLVQNSVKGKSTGLSTKVTTTSGWDGKSDYTFSANLTPEEARYYFLLTSNEDKVDFLKTLLYSREGPNAKTANQRGIVRVTSNTSTTSAGEYNKVEYFIDPMFKNVDQEAVDKYTKPARAAVLNNDMTDLMQRIIDENDKK